MVTDSHLDDLVLAEAAAWLTELRGAERTPESEAAFKQWLAKPAHASAFAKVTSAWEVIPGAVRQANRRLSKPASPFRLIAAAAAAILIVTIICNYSSNSKCITGLGQQKTVILNDKTELILNTDTLLVTKYSISQRNIYLEHGEAMFNVAKDARRPFVVHIGDAQVRALGTSFVVKSTAAGVAVSLIHGRVEVSERQVSTGPRRLALLSPGDQLTIGSRGATISRMDAQSLTAWRQQQVVFDDVRLEDAAAEFARYGGQLIRIEDRRVADLRVSGTFRDDDPWEFASAIAQLHQLRIKRSGQEILIQP